MNDKDDKFLYQFSWKQVYTGWEQQLDEIDKLMDIIVDSTGYIDANEVINNIKGKLNG